MQEDRDNLEEKLTEKMLEASLLPAGDPLRNEFEAGISRQSEKAESLWLEMLQENERLRIDLRRVEIPEGLGASLLGLAQTPGYRWLSGLAAPGRLLKAAAVVLLALAFGGTLFYQLDTSEKNKKFKAVAELALDGHLHDQNVDVVTLDPAYLQSHLAGDIPFEIVMPAINSEFTLVGGRSCSMGAHPVLYTRWASREGRCSIFQFRSSDFGLPQQSGKEVIPGSKVNCPEARGRDCNTVVWSEAGRGYVLVADSTCALKSIASGSQKP